MAPTKKQMEQFKKDCITPEGYCFCNLESARRNNIIPPMFVPEDEWLGNENTSIGTRSKHSRKPNSRTKR